MGIYDLSSTSYHLSPGSLGLGMRVVDHNRAHQYLSDFPVDNKRKLENDLRRLEDHYVQSFLRDGLPIDEFRMGFNLLVKSGASYEHMEIYAEASEKLLEEGLSPVSLTRLYKNLGRLRYYPHIMKVFVKMQVEDMLKDKQRKIEEAVKIKETRMQRNRDLRNLAIAGLETVTGLAQLLLR